MVVDLHDGASPGGNSAWPTTGSLRSPRHSDKHASAIQRRPPARVRVRAAAVGCHRRRISMGSSDSLLMTRASGMNASKGETPSRLVSDNLMWTASTVD